MLSLRTCFRCGQPVYGARVCAQCRKGQQPKPFNRELSFRERQVIDLVSHGKLNKLVAVELHLTEGTIKEYLFRIFRKVRVTNRTELTVWWLTEGKAAYGARHPEAA